MGKCAENLPHDPTTEEGAGFSFKCTTTINHCEADCVLLKNGEVHSITNQ